MEGNNKIAFTAEAVAFMRASENMDEFSKYFVSSEIKKKLKFVNCIFTKKYIKNLFERRISLSIDLDNIIKKYRPEQVVEIACGYSPRGLAMTKKNPNLVYIETDFGTVIRRKKQILKEQNIKISKNHHFVEADSIKDDLENKIGKLINKNKKTLIITEALTSYLDKKEYEFLISNILKLLKGVRQAAYLSHENKKMVSGIFGRLLLFYRNRISKTKGHKHFSNKKEIKNYFLKKGFSKVDVVESKKSFNLLYLVYK